MNSKFYVSLEAARLLKEKGYNEVTNGVWNGFFGDMRISPQNGGYRNLDYPDDMQLYSAPTKAEAIDWLESKGIIVETFYLRFDQEWFYDVFVLSTRESYTSDDLHSRLEAEEAAIIKALELL